MGSFKSLPTNSTPSAVQFFTTSAAESFPCWNGPAPAMNLIPAAVLNEWLIDVFVLAASAFHENIDVNLGVPP